MSWYSGARTASPEEARIMCGIAGFFRPAGLAANGAEPDLARMSACLFHRGPDDSGTWVDAAAGIALGHRRLSILDLSSAGHQPMVSASGRYVIAFNGEIYNHPEVRRELELSEASPQWRGHSDTEILLSAFDRWGIEAALTRTVGMFAFALWDRNERILTLARDRLGEKPLYYGWQGDLVLFGSELKALRAHPAFRSGIDRNVLALYLRRGYIMAPYSIYRGIFKLVPGSYVQFSRQEPSSLPARPRTYWSLREVVARGLAEPFAGSDPEGIAQLESELARAVVAQSVADVPLGAFLSGGVDSSTIVALMQAHNSRSVKTFTIGFHEDCFNEANHARDVAQLLGTDHTELYVTAREASDVIPKLATLYDEPFGDSSAIPSFLVSQLARRHVTVALSGDGGDELFGGYARYQRTNDIWSSVRRVPYFARKAVSLGVSAFSRRSNAVMRAKADRLAHYLGAKDATAIYRAQTAHRYDTHELVIAESELCDETAADTTFGPADLYFTMMYLDASTYLPDDILVKVDRASMAVSLEARAPMLDHRVVEFAWRLPLRLRVRGRTGKWLLKQVLRKYLPDSVVERQKMGFGVPVGEWIRGPLRDWAESLLGEERLTREGYLNPRVAREQWLSHLAGDSTGSDSTWHLLAFQAWVASLTSH
jgi:asparagine synthase (glutamine-hydrolysing)